MKTARLIKHAIAPTALQPFPSPSLVKREATNTVRHWVEEHQRNSQIKPHAAFAALFVPTDAASVKAGEKIYGG